MVFSFFRLIDLIPLWEDKAQFVCKFEERVLWEKELHLLAKVSFFGPTIFGIFRDRYCTGDKISAICTSDDCTHVRCRY